VTPPFQLDDDNLSETVRLTTACIDLRRPQMQKNLMLRYKTWRWPSAASSTSNGFIDIETPMLTKSTPEGARDYLVPSPRARRPVLRAAAVAAAVQAAADGGRLRPLLPDHQVLPRRGPARRPPARIHPDRHRDLVPDEHEITAIIEGMIRTCSRTRSASSCRPFPRMTYAEAMRRYGSDKPDLRVTARTHRVTDG
jgi:aspartyl-tRNA synthetase